MNYNYFVKSQIKSHRFLFAVGVMQMAIVVYLIIILFSNFNDMNYVTDLFKKMNSDNYIYITRTITGIFEKDAEEEEIYEEYQTIRTKNIESGMDLHEAGEKAWEELGDLQLDARRIDEDDISDMPYLKNIWYIDDSPVFHSIGNDDFEPIKMLDSEFAEKLNYNIKKGVWLDKAKSSGKTIDAVVANNIDYKIGDIISVDEYEFNGREYISADTGYKIRIIGILDYGEAELTLASTNSNLDSCNFYDVIESYCDNTFLVLKKDLQPCLDERGYDANDSDHNYVIAEISADASQQQEITDYLSAKRLAGVSLKRMYSNTLDYQRNAISDSVVPTIAASLFAVFVIISISIFQMQYMSKKYRIFYLCGMEKGKEKLIQMLYTTRIMITAIVISLAYYTASEAWRYFKATAELTEQGYSKEDVRAWYSISDFVKIKPVSVLLIAALALVIIMLSTMLCSRSIKYGKDS